MTSPTPLLPCRVKGCPWRGPDPTACPMHESDSAWDRQWSLWPETLSKKAQTRRR